MTSRALLEIERLIQLLRMVDESPTPYRSKIYYDETHPAIRDIIYYATEYLTVGPDVHLYRSIVKEAGYPVYPGEVDGFGWLTAYFQMKEGIILFG
jgi:hypothetical protein